MLRYKSVKLKYVGHENAGYIKFSVLAFIISDFYKNFTYTEHKYFIYQR